MTKKFTYVGACHLNFSSLQTFEETTPPQKLLPLNMPSTQTQSQLVRFRRRQMVELRKRVLQHLMPPGAYRVEVRRWQRRRNQLRIRLYGVAPNRSRAVWDEIRSCRPDLHRQELMLWDSFLAERLEERISQYGGMEHIY